MKKGLVQNNVGPFPNLNGIFRKIVTECPNCHVPTEHQGLNKIRIDVTYCKWCELNFCICPICKKPATVMIEQRPNKVCVMHGGDCDYPYLPLI